MTSAEIHAYNLGRSISLLGDINGPPIDPAAGCLNFEVPELARAAQRKLGPVAFAHWVRRGMEDARAKPNG